jgi:hypothetical protein
MLVLLFAVYGQSYYAMCWSTDASGAPVIAVGGLRALIKIISCAERKVTAVLAGHGSAVNDIKAHPVSNNDFKVQDCSFSEAALLAHSFQAGILKHVAYGHCKMSSYNIAHSCKHSVQILTATPGE